MKMIYLANVRIPTEKAHGVNIMKMCEAFKNEGIDIELVAAKRIDNQLEGKNPYEYYGIINKFPIKKIWLLDIIAMGRSIKGLSVLIQNTSFAVSAFFNLFKKKVDLIYSRDEFSLLFLSLFKKNLIYELHIFPQSKLHLYRFLCKRVKKIVVITHSLKKLLVERLKISENKILVSPDGVDLDKFNLKNSKDKCRKDLDLPNDKKIILYSGHLFAWKGVYTLVDASKYLSDEYRILIVGGMDYDRKKLKVYIDQHSLINIQFISHQEPYKIPLYLKAADVLVLPNSAKKKISKFYTSPVKMFEYMASKRPIIASDLPSIKEILDDDNSVLVEPDNPQELARGIKEILSDNKLSEQIVNKAHQDVQQFSWQKRAKNILSFIK